MVRLEGLGKLKKKLNDLIGIGTRHLPAYSIAHQSSTLPRALKITKEASKVALMDNYLGTAK
jgi:hypothetical protein